MLSNIKPTSYYKDIFKGETIKEKYQDFAKWYLGLEINDNQVFLNNRNLTPEDVLGSGNIEIRDDGVIVYTYDNDKKLILDIPTLKTFATIFYEYSDSHIACSDESFRFKYANIMATYYKEYEQTTKAITNLMNLTDNDIAIDNYIITNSAEIPETPSSTSIEEVDYVSVQQKNFTKKGKLQISKELLYNKKSYTTKTFLNRFRYLFIRILSNSYTPVYENELEV